LRRYLLQSDAVSNPIIPPSPLVQPDVDVAEFEKFPPLTWPKNPAVFNEIDGQQIYEMGSNFSESSNRSNTNFREPTAQAQIISYPSPSATDTKPHQEMDEDAENLEPPVIPANQALDMALSTLRPALSETIELKALGPTFGIDLEVLYQRDGVLVPRVLQYCIAVAQQVGLRTSKVYDLEADQDDVIYLKDRFDNGRPVQVQARAIFDHRTVDPRKLSFSKGDQILVLGLRDENWFLGCWLDKSGLLPIGFVEFDVEHIADIIGTCKAFFMELPDSLISKVQYDSLIKAAGNRTLTLVSLLTQLTSIGRNRISWRPP
jgi:hypothetical protein